MYIDYKVYEASNVERLSDIGLIMQGENNFTILRFALPEKIRGCAVANYKQEIKFENEKGAIFRYSMSNGEYALPSEVTRNKRVKVQLILTNRVDDTRPIEWRSIPFELDFEKSINAVKAIGD